MTKQEMMEKLAGMTDMELEGAIRSIEIQRQIKEEVSKTAKEEFEDKKCHLSEISITCLITLKAEKMEDLLKDVTKFQNEVMKSPDVANFASVREMEMRKWSSSGYSSCSMTVDYKLGKEDIDDLNAKMFRFF